MANGTTQGGLARELGERTDAANRRARELTERLDGAAMDWRPPEGGWSAGQVLEHLIVSADSYLERFPGLFARAKHGAGGPATRWKPSAMGGWLANALRPGTRKMPAPKIYRPAADARPNVLAEFLARQDRFVQAMEQAADLDWRRVRMGSPVLALIRVNLGDAFVINTVHVERHLGQVERVLAARQALTRLA
jgi:hypothetical protein